MGRCNIDFEIAGKASIKVIEKCFKTRQSIDRDNYGNDPYSGTFNTIDGVKLHDKVFNNYTEAYGYCFDNSEKWSNAVAVYYHDLSSNKKYNELSTKLSKLELKEDVKAIKRKLFIQLKNAKSKKITCKYCTSSIPRSYLVNENCLVCRHDLFSKSDKSRIDRALVANKKAVEKAKIALEKHEKKLSKSANLKTLVAGWAAC